MSASISLQTIPWQTIHATNTLNNAIRSLESGVRPASGKGSPRLKETCSELESLFIFYLFKEMRATVPKTGFISGGKAEEIYTSMLDFKLAKDLSHKGGIGLSSLLLDQLSETPEQTEAQNERK